MRKLKSSLFSILFVLPCVGLPVSSSATPADENLDCLIVPEQSQLELTLATDTDDRVFGEDDLLRFGVLNYGSEAAKVSISVVVFSELGINYLQDFVSTSLDAGGSSSLPVRIGELSLPAAGIELPGHLIVTAKAQLSNDRVVVPDNVLRLSFLPTGKSWRVSPELAMSTTNTRSVKSTSWGTGPALIQRLPVPNEQVDEDGPPDFVFPVAKRESQEADTGLMLQFCFDQISTFLDAGIGEDYWKNDFPTARKSRGSYVEIRRGGRLQFSGFLGDGLGAGDPGLACTPLISGTTEDETYDIVIESRGEVQGNIVEAVEDGVGEIRSFSTDVLASSGIYNVTIDPAAQFLEFNIYMAGAHALYRHAGGMQSQIYHYRINSGGGSRYSRSTDTIYIHPNHHFKKFVVVHETGHAMGDFGTGNNNFKLVGINCEDFSDPVCPAAGGQHSMASREFARCALGEGFAHFFAADIYNSHSEPECYLHYYKNEFGEDSSPIVDCEDENGQFDEKFMETSCPTPWNGYGTELDWLRALWDVHTDGKTPPSFTEMIGWFNEADSWNNFTAFDRLDDEADSVGGSLNSNWDLSKAQNGIDWPGDSIIFIDGFETGNISAWTQ